MEYEKQNKWTNITKQTQRHRESLLSRGRGEGKGRTWESVISSCRLWHIGWINNKVLLYSSGNSIQYPVINHHGKKKYKEECMYV